MKNKKILTSAACLLAFTGLSTIEANAAAFYIPYHSTSTTGSNLAGASSEARDASILYFNPSAVTDLDGPQVTFSLDGVLPSLNLENRGSTISSFPVGGPDSDDPVDPFVVPNLFIAAPIYNDDLWFGLSLSTPFALKTEYQPTWYGRYDSISSDLVTYDIQPSLSYRVNDWFAVGGGLNIQYADAKLVRAVTDGTEGLSTVEGDDLTVGFNAGFTVMPTEKTTVGVNYRSGISHKLEGDLRVTGTAMSDENSSASADLDLPEIVSFGVSHDIRDDLTLLAQADWLSWNRFSSLDIVRSNGTVATSDTQNYESTWMLAVGAEYDWDEDLTLRAGYSHDQTPTQDGFRSTQVPDGDRNSVSVGLSYDHSEKLTLDLAANYTVISDEEIRVTRNLGAAAINADTSDGSFGILSVGFSYKF